MFMSSGVKTGFYTISAALLWITANLGWAFYILVAAYIFDFALHYSQKFEFVQKMTYYLGSTSFAYYLQNGQAFANVELLHGLIALMAAHEVLEVFQALKVKLDDFKKKYPKEAAQVETVESILTQAENVAPGLIASLQAAKVAQQHTPEGSDAP